VAALAAAVGALPVVAPAAAVAPAAVAAPAAVVAAAAAAGPAAVAPAAVLAPAAAAAAAAVPLPQLIGTTERRNELRAELEALGWYFHLGADEPPPASQPPIPAGAQRYLCGFTPVS
jgi:hypothetical protein